MGASASLAAPEDGNHVAGRDLWRTRTVVGRRRRLPHRRQAAGSGRRGRAPRHQAGTALARCGPRRALRRGRAGDGAVQRGPREGKRRGSLRLRVLWLAMGVGTSARPQHARATAAQGAESQGGGVPDPTGKMDGHGGARTTAEEQQERRRASTGGAALRLRSSVGPRAQQPGACVGR